jgi:hypothetical protein
MEAGENSVMCMGLILGPNKTDEIMRENDGNGNDPLKFHCIRLAKKNAECAHLCGRN